MCMRIRLYAYAFQTIRIILERERKKERKGILFLYIHNDERFRIEKNMLKKNCTSIQMICDYFLSPMASMLLFRRMRCVIVVLLSNWERKKIY